MLKKKKKKYSQYKENPMQRLPIFRDLCLKTCNRNPGRRCQMGLKGGAGVRVTCR